MEHLLLVSIDGLMDTKLFCHSLLGMEVAAYLADKAKNVTCVDVCDIPFGRILGSRVGVAIQKVGMAGTGYHSHTHPDTMFTVWSA